MEWLNFIGSILGGLIGGLFTFYGVKMTISYENKKILKEKEEKKLQNKPRLEIVEKTGILEVTKDHLIKGDLNVVMLDILKYSFKDRPLFYYDESAKNMENLCYKEYVFKNNGVTEIEFVSASTNLQKQSSLFELNSYKFFIENNMLNYEGWCRKKYIKNGDNLIMRIYYRKDKTIFSNIDCNTITLWIKDIDGNLWRQHLNVYSDEISKTFKTNFIEFEEEVNIETAFECFENPILW